MSAPIIGLLKAVATPVNLVRIRSKVLARADRRMRTELVEVRRQNGLTQADVAERMGVSQQAVQKLERYDADPKLSTLRRYSNAVGAVVEHQVSRDEGQSRLMGEDTQWKRVGHLPPMDNVQFVVSGDTASSRAAWSKRQDFALSA